MMDLLIDPVLESAIRPLSGDEYRKLRENILADGRILDPIKVWRAPEGLTIVDGHNRWSIYQTNADALPAPRVELLDFASRDDVLEWMKKHQRGRRNLSVDQQILEDVRAGRPVAHRIKRSQAADLLEHAPEEAALVAAGKRTLQTAYNDWRKKQGPPALSLPRPTRAQAKVTTPPVPEMISPLEEHKLKIQTSALEALKRDLLKQIADRDEQIAVLSQLRAQAPVGPVVLHKKAGDKQRKGVPVMLCSDWHVEEPVEPAKVNGLNEYNLEIADRCIDRMADAFEWMLRDARYDCRAGVVWLGGDLFSGYIHEELQEGNALSPVESVLWLQERLERMLRKIAASCPQLDRIIVPCNDGNHGRLTNKTRVSTRTANSLEYMLYQTLAVRLSDDPRFQFQIAEGEWTYLDVFDQTLAFTHGDTFRYGGGVGGISIPLRKGINEMRKYRKVSHVSLGHFHQRSDFGDISVNGSMIGVNPYSMHIHASPEPRQQSWFMIDETRGKSITAPIWL